MTDPSKKPAGSLIVFEGPDGVGKTTLSKQFTEHLSQIRRVPCEWFAFPGQEPSSLGKLVYELHHNSASAGVKTIHPASMQLLHVAAHIDMIEERILPALREGKTVVLDRFWWSTWAYGSLAAVEPMSLRKMLDLEAVHWHDVLPEIVFLIDRAAPPKRDSKLQWSVLREHYRALIDRESGRHPIIRVQNDGPLVATLNVLVAALRLRPASDTQKRNLRAAITSSDSGNLTVGRRGSGHVTPVARLSPAKASLVYDTYWQFASERQAIFFRRFRGEPSPWSNDPIFQTYKFTNAYRASDRTSQFLIRDVIYKGASEPNEICFRVLLFKLFNRIETWELLRQHIHPISYRDYSFSLYDKVLNRALERGQPIYSAAYIMPSGGASSPYSRKHQMHLHLIEQMMRDELPERIAEAPSMGKAFELLRAYPTIGDFLAYQYVTDLNYSPLTTFSETEFVVAGPGARDGIRKCFTDFGGLSESEIIKFVADRQQIEAERLGIEIQTLWGRPLQYIDCQNLFCEVDKYARIAHPDVTGYTGRSRIKQKFRPLDSPVKYYFPPKWRLNELIEQEGSAGVLDI